MFGNNTDAQPPQSPFSPPIRYITTHDPATRQSVFTTALPVEVPGLSMSGFTIFDAYKTLTSPISLNDEADLSALIHQNPSTPSQPPPPGTTTASTAAAAAPDTENGAIWFPAGDPTQTLFRYCDWAPGASSVDHRTETLDIGVVVAGQMEARLDSGEVRTLNVGDTIVQRGTMHSWRNPSDTEWARMVVFLVGVEDVSVGGVKLGGAMG